MNTISKIHRIVDIFFHELKKHIFQLKFTLKNDITWIKVLVSIFLLLGLVGVFNHEMWRDELQAWMIARDSSSLIDLYKNLRYEGHPSLWYFFLYVITRFTDNPLAMQLLHLVIASVTVYIFAKFSPFTKLQKILFSFGYFPFYEYHLIGRNYSLGILFIFLFCHFFTKIKRNYLVLSIVLTFLANTNVYGTIVAISLAATLIFENFLSRKSKKIEKFSFINILILTCGVAIAIVQVIPPNDAKFQGIIKSNLTPINHINYLLFSIVPAVWKSYIPVPNFFNYNFWNTNFFVNNDSSKLITLCICLLSLILLFSATVLFFQQPVALFAYTFGTSSLIWFGYEKFFGDLRHHGHLFILFIACLWIANYYSPSDSRFQARNVAIARIKNLSVFLSDRKKTYINILLCIHLLSGVYAYSMDLIYPFSASKEVASFLTNRQLKDTLIIGSQDNEVSPIAALTNKSIYYIESSGFGSFINWNQRKNLDLVEITNKISMLAKQSDRPILLILSYRLDKQILGLALTEIYKSAQSIAPGETYYLYQVVF